MPSRPRLLAAPLLVILLAACASPPPPRPVVDDTELAESYSEEPLVESCGGDYDCKPGQICAGDRCEVVCDKPAPLTIAFPDDDARVPEDAITALESVALCHRAWPESKLRLEGYASVYDPAGQRRDKDGAQSLSDRLAKSVDHILTRRYLAVPNRISVDPHGAEGAACNTPDAACRQRSQRVEVVWERTVKPRETDDGLEIGP